MSWKWKNGQSAVLTNKVESYSRNLVGDKKAGFEDEIERWIKEEILVTWEGEVEGYLALMAVEQPTKNKVRPVWDYRELNKSAECHAGDNITADVCSEKLSS